MKKVAFVAPTYPVLSETFIQTEVESVKACGHDVCVMAFKIENSEKQFDYDIVEIGKNVRMGKIPSINWLGFIKAVSFVSKQNSMPKRSLFVYGFKLALQLAEKDIDHVHAHFCQHTAAHAIVAAKLLNITCSFVAHGHDVYEFAYDIEHKISSSDFVVAVCKDMLTDFNNMAKGNIKLLHCGVNTNQFKLQPKTDTKLLRLVFLGRLVEQKGIHYLIDALAPIAQPLNIHLDIVGTGDMEQQLKTQVDQHGLTQNVTFLGAQPHEWVKENLPNYDSLIAPFCFSETGCVDTGPLVLKEAMAVGTPVITTNIMGCKEIVTPETGFLVNEKSVEELRDTIERFAQLSSNDKTEMGMKARTRVEQNFNSFKQAQQLSHWIENPA
ncbi:glycosyltransferase [Vibrio crassostreae]|uniref:glycosyltransferase n=1 Tax=Vibrio crassostreae TaxID=246167 RepID=UPI0010510220|nr:glycosyltransferase [Vibrio crassostreae]TCN92285.1 glycosyltransferase involved in cell wall biosynthesis [Vibrio crassostreae]CAK2000195.1 colanic acid/amylovoran biosynthesis glycosyltransferase [Vibrio crassostreae]CAK2001911.1 colanic acid/amylovoran biosynthesis glycosyltransferase [Vibrio crassostreae]CAK2004785.1 colanic acid/amylovoran biosynthesis glycosyltransferase [Vibrio crassostreae]CAK2788001.1 colanic acid/amylovoran biosynthesis glycosyltransferase [Vibrio crassostreae]